jgi:hypothetical protein
MAATMAKYGKDFLVTGRLSGAGRVNAAVSRDHRTQNGNLDSTTKLPPTAKQV